MPKGQYERTRVPCAHCGRMLSYVHMAQHVRVYHEGQGSTEYFACHVRIRNILGKPSQCELCSNEEGRRLYWANLSGQYDDPSDYISLCASCHHHFDAEEKGNTGQRHYIRCKICDKLVRSKESATDHKYCSKKCMCADPDWRAQLTGKPSRLTDDQIKEIQGLQWEVSQRELAERFGISQAMVSLIQKREAQ